MPEGFLGFLGLGIGIFFFFFLKNCHRTWAGGTPKTPETPSPTFGMHRTLAGSTPETPKTQHCRFRPELNEGPPPQQVMRIILILVFGSRHESS